MRVNENSFILFVTALDFIEEHLTEEFSQEEIAAKCYCSLSSLQKTWKICTHMSIKEYVSKRRLTLAGRDMLSGMSVLDAALKYGYNSHEVFTRPIFLWHQSSSAGMPYHDLDRDTASWITFAFAGLYLA